MRARIHYAIDVLNAPATCSCQRCGCAAGSVSIVTLDTDQGFFEACSASAVLQAWDAVEHVIQERIGSRVCVGQAWEERSHIIFKWLQVWVVVDQPRCGQASDSCLLLGVAGLCGRIGV